MNEDWLKDIHDRMADFEMEEPAGLWEELHLNDNKVQAPKQKQTMWLLPRRLAAVAVVLVGMFAGYHFLTDISIYNKVEKGESVALGDSAVIDTLKKADTPAASLNIIK